MARYLIVGLGLLAFACQSGAPNAPSGDAAPGDGTASAGDGAAAGDVSGGDRRATGDPVTTSGDPEPGDVTPGDAAAVTWVAPYGLLSLNLHCLRTDGTSYSDNGSRFAAVASACATENVAVIAVQEACDNGQENGLAILRAELESATGATWSSAFGFAHKAWVGTADEADEGVGLLVRGELRDEAAVQYHAQGSLIRVGIAATLPPELGGLRVHSVHLDHQNEVVRLKQAREAAALALSEGDPSLDLIIAGDLNTREGTAPHDAFAAMGFRDLSDSLASARIDHVFAHRGAGLRATAARSIFDGAGTPVVSDHAGVLVGLEPAAGEAVLVTRVDAFYDAGWGHHLSLRGDTAPLDWILGWPAHAIASDRWRLVLTELPVGDFELKWLIDDSTWQTGANSVGSAGVDNVTSPAF